MSQVVGFSFKRLINIVEQSRPDHLLCLSPTRRVMEGAAMIT